jgi:hypothetical protein
LTTANAHATARGYDKINQTLLEGDRDFNLYTDSFSGSAFSAHTLVQNYAGTPNSLNAYNGLRSYLVANDNISIWQQLPPSGPQSRSAAGATLKSLTIGPDKRTYALDSVGRKVWVEAGLTTPLLFSASTFSGSTSSQTENLAIGPDGVAYSSDGASLVESLSAAGVTSSVSLPPPSGGVGVIRAVFNGNNGYVYAYYDDGFHNGTQNVFRISY